MELNEFVKQINQLISAPEKEEELATFVKEKKE